ncbi:lytic murein transglycosylase [Hydrogenophaga sp.]|uniref:lytic murein transglycosylase n=1 Tax=Hydrogenophaga sp. TaxID=1904254 RepID=UPI0019B59FA2|nr:lytic murein transglycosylase [Hydrogenophaga sp.]MBD3893376.1 lytic murein transglycosylase [Hydrogenophaga sp.]
MQTKTPATLLLLALLSLPATADPAFERCIEQLRVPARSAGVLDATFTQHTRDLRPDLSVIERLNHQPEFRTPIWDYLAGLVDDERIRQGQALLAQHAELLERIQQRHGVDPAIVVAIWGVESNFGQTLGRFSLPQALGTLSCMGRRQTFFRAEFFAALRILQAGHVEPEQLVGSWAGAFGHTQFMPSTFERLAQDFDGDGRADLIGNPADALASTAHFLRRAGWQTGQTWGFEVRLPDGLSTAGEGRRSKRPRHEWVARGLTLVDGSALPADLGQAGLITPAGRSGPAFLLLRNFDALFGYNPAESYALAIGHLADRLRGADPFVTPWPTDDGPLSRAERRELQALLILRGHEIGAIDGMLGARSRAAILQEQTRLGFAASGRGGQQLLQALRRPAQSTAQ